MYWTHLCPKAEMCTDIKYVMRALLSSLVVKRRKGGKQLFFMRNYFKTINLKNGINNDTHIRSHNYGKDVCIR